MTEISAVQTRRKSKGMVMLKKQYVYGAITVFLHFSHPRLPCGPCLEPVQKPHSTAGLGAQPDLYPSGGELFAACSRYKGGGHRRP